MYAAIAPALAQPKISRMTWWTSLPTITLTGTVIGFEPHLIFLKLSRRDRISPPQPTDGASRRMICGTP